MEKVNITKYYIQYFILVLKDKINFYHGKNIGSSESLNESRKMIPKGWKLIQPIDQKKHPEIITITDNFASRWELFEMTLPGFWERYIKIENTVPLTS